MAAGIEPGAMTLVDAAGAETISHACEAWEEVAGGSAANTAAGIASLGGSVAFAGSIGADLLGRRYVTDLESAGVRCVAHPLAGEEPTGVCHVLVAPDGERSMATLLGAAGHLSPAAVEEVGLGEASIVYLEGYLLDAQAAAAVARAIELAHEAGTIVALSLSDPFVVERHKEALLDLVNGGTVGLLFGNEEELSMLSGRTDLDEAMSALARPGLLGFVTRGSAGSVVWSGDERSEIEPDVVEEVVDTTGAGDLYAAGVLFGLVTGETPRGAGRLGSLAAAEAISHLGARPRTELAALLASRRI